MSWSGRMRAPVDSPRPGQHVPVVLDRGAQPEAHDDGSIGPRLWPSTRHRRCAWRTRSLLIPAHVVDERPAASRAGGYILVHAAAGEQRRVASLISGRSHLLGAAVSRYEGSAPRPNRRSRAGNLGERRRRLGASSSMAATSSARCGSWRPERLAERAFSYDQRNRFRLGQHGCSQRRRRRSFSERWPVSRCARGTVVEVHVVDYRSAVVRQESRKAAVDVTPTSGLALRRARTVLHI